MATLQNKRIKDTYQGLLKTEDNNIINNTLRQITDGQGTGTGISLNSQGDLTATGDVVANSFTGDGSNLTNVPNIVTSVNTQIGDIILDTDDIAEGSNEYYTDAKVEANTAVAANTAKVGITAQQTADILTNNSKVGITTDQANAIIANTAKNSYPTDDATKLAGIEDNADVTDTTNVTSGLVSATSISEDDKATIRTNIGVGGATSVTSVNTQTGAVILDTDDIDEGTNNLYYTEARADARVNLQTGANLDLSNKSTSDLSEGTNLYYTDARVSANSSVAANTAKNSYPSADASKLSGIEAGAEVNPTNTDGLSEGSSNLYYTEARVSANTNVVANTAKVGITTQQASDITANNAKVGITTQQAADITANNAKVSMVLGTSAGTALEGDTALLQLGTTSTTALAGDTTTISAQQALDITANNAKISFDGTSSTKLGTIEENADVTDTANVTAAGALMDSEVVNLAQVKAFDSSNYATAAQGTKADAALPEADVDADIKTLSLPANTTISDFAKTILGDADASTVRTTIGAGTSSLVLGTSAGTALEGDTVIPTNNNQLTNGAGYINEAAQTIHTNAIGNAIDFSARVTLDGGVAEGTSGIIKNLQNIL